MVARLRDHYGIRDQKVLDAINAVPRHAFVPEALQGRAYGDHALPISANQTISQPFIVARMTELLELDQNSRVLEIGAGSVCMACAARRYPPMGAISHQRGRLARPHGEAPPEGPRARLHSPCLHRYHPPALDGGLGLRCLLRLPARLQTRSAALLAWFAAVTRSLGSFGHCPRLD